MSRKAYIAKYPLNVSGDDLDEIILARDTYCSPELNKIWDELIVKRQKGEPMLQMWYSDENQVTCCATTNQPFPLS